MIQQKSSRFLFVINALSGNNSRDWSKFISDYFAETEHVLDLYELEPVCDIQKIKDRIAAFKPHLVVAVGGDGTVKLVATCLLQQNIPMGILPAGSANGLAKELGIGADPRLALDILLEGNPKKMHATQVNGHLCIHLSDIGLNAYAMKIFETQRVRGMWGYLVASIKVLWQKPMLDIELQMAKEIRKIKAEMIVIANGTRYGSGALINPEGRLDDDLFEVIVLKQVTVREMLKVIFLRKTYNANLMQVFQTKRLSLRSVKKVHFQVDGEYLGKVNEVNAVLLPDALQVMVPVPVPENGGS